MKRALQILSVGVFVVWLCAFCAGAQTPTADSPQGTKAAKAAVGYNNLALTPAMGWSSWNHYGCSGVNEAVIKQQAAAMASSGLKAAGYTYVNLDDCWMAANRDANGNLVPDPTKFPDGMPALVSYVHGLGLKLGLYEDVGTTTCDNGNPGSFGHYQQDANTFAAWGIDYIKMDWCSNSGLDPQTAYTQFSQALAATNANIVFSICDWGTKEPWKWAPAIANSWRTTPDIVDNWLSMLNNLEATSSLAFAAKPGAWNDPDMLEVGNGGMTDTEDRTHFAMWALLSAPLIAGTDLTNMSSNTLATLTNSEVIAVDQDALGKQGILLSDNGAGLQVWSKQVTGGTVVALLNKSMVSAAITANWSDLGLEPSQSVTVRDIWNHVDLGSYTASISSQVPSHGVTLLKLGATATPPAQTVYQADSSVNQVSGGAIVSPCSMTWGYMCLDGVEVGYIGNGGTITFEDVNAATAGLYNMTIYGMLSGTRVYDVSVNGAEASPVTLTGSSFSFPSASGLQVQLNAGANSIQLGNSSTWAPDLDHIVLTPVGTANTDFNIVYPIQNVTVSAGNTATTSVALVPVGGFTGTVALNCTLPASMAGATCSTSNVALGGWSSATALITIHTTASVAALERGSDKTGRVVVSQQHKPAAFPAGRKTASGILSAGIFPITALTLAGIGLAFKSPRKSKLFMLLLFCISAAGVLQLAACGKAYTTCSAIPAAPTNLTSTSTGSTGTTLSWTLVSGGSSCAVSSYSIYQNKKLVGTTTSTTYSVTGLSPATTYGFYVVANDSIGPSAPSPSLSVTTGAAPTTSGTYTVTLTATSGNLSHSSEFQVTVE